MGPSHAKTAKECCTDSNCLHIVSQAFQLIVDTVDVNTCSASLLRKNIALLVDDSLVHAHRDKSLMQFKQGGSN